MFQWFFNRRKKCRDGAPPESLPTRTDISAFGSLDEKRAIKHFLGKDLRQAEALFRENFGVYAEDLMWMGPRAFCFYVDAAIAYLASPDSAGDNQAACGFYSAVEFQVEHYRKEINSSLSRIEEAIQLILSDIDRFECGYVDLASRYRNLLAKIRA